MTIKAIYGRSGLLRAGGFGALALALAAAAPSAASAQQQGHGRWGGGQAGAASPGGGSQGGGSQGGGWQRHGGDGGGHGHGATVNQSPVQRQAPNGGNANGWRGRTSTVTQGTVQAPSRGHDSRWGDGSRSGGDRGWRDRAVTGQAAAEAQRQQQVQVHRDWNGRNRTYADPQRNGTYRQDWRNRQNWNGNHQASRNFQRWNQDWRRDNRYDWQRYRSEHRDRFHIGRYYSPYRNYTYRRPFVGFYLDPLFYGNSFWIDDPWDYRLPPAEGPYRWVRYYDDALLVNVETGEVVDVINDFFW
jgi:hypothetical protein